MTFFSVVICRSAQSFRPPFRTVPPSRFASYRFVRPVPRAIVLPLIPSLFFPLPSILRLRRRLPSRLPACAVDGPIAAHAAARHTAPLQLRRSDARRGFSVPAHHPITPRPPQR